MSDSSLGESRPIAADVFAAWLCRSVGATWTVELRPADRVEAPSGPVADWICSGIPTELPAPDAQLADVLCERGLLLYTDDRDEREPRTRSRRLIGLVTRDPEVLRLALMLAELTDESPAHPMPRAAQWIDAGYSPEAAAGWASAGITSPTVARNLLCTELERPIPLQVVPRELTGPTRRGG